MLILWKWLSKDYFRFIWYKFIWGCLDPPRLFFYFVGLTPFFRCIPRFSNLFLSFGSTSSSFLTTCCVFLHVLFLCISCFSNTLYIYICGSCRLLQWLIKAMMVVMLLTLKSSISSTFLLVVPWHHLYGFSNIHLEPFFYSTFFLYHHSTLLHGTICKDSLLSSLIHIL